MARFHQGCAPVKVGRERERERRVSVYEEEPGFRLGPRQSRLEHSFRYTPTVSGIVLGEMN